MTDDIVFEIEGVAAGGLLKPVVLKAMEYLDALPFPKLIGIKSLAAAVQSCDDYLRNSTSIPEMDPYRMKYRNVVLYGSPRTIEAARAKVEAVGHL